MFSHFCLLSLQPGSLRCIDWSSRPVCLDKCRHSPGKGLKWMWDLACVQQSDFFFLSQFKSNARRSSNPELFHYCGELKWIYKNRKQELSLEHVEQAFDGRLCFSHNHCMIIPQSSLHTISRYSSGAQ